MSRPGGRKVITGKIPVQTANVKEKVKGKKMSKKCPEHVLEKCQKSVNKVSIAKPSVRESDMKSVKPASCRNTCDMKSVNPYVV